MRWAASNPVTPHTPQVRMVPSIFLLFFLLCSQFFQFFFL